MYQGSNRRLANVRTRTETGLDYVYDKLDLRTPFGIKELKQARPFFPGEEDELREEFSKIRALENFAVSDPRSVNKLYEVFYCIKDITNSVERSRTGVLSVVDIFEIKSSILYAQDIYRIITGKAAGEGLAAEQNCCEPIKGLAAEQNGCTPDEGSTADGTAEAAAENAVTGDAKAAGTVEAMDAAAARAAIPEEFIPDPLEGLLDILDPRKDRINTFYIYDEFSPKLAALRAQKREIDVDIRKVRRVRRDEIKKEYGLLLTPKFDIVIPKSSDDLAKAREIPDLEVVNEDYTSVTFELGKNDAVYELVKKGEELTIEIDEEEEAVLRVLTGKIHGYADDILENFRRIGRLDLVLAKAVMASQNGFTEPVIVQEHCIKIENGKQIQVADVLKSKGKEYCPISIELPEGVTCITGANMGGKTVSLKLVGLTALMTQYGFFVPCERAEVGLSNFIQILVGDSQSVERGLSSFGSEMEELKEILDHAQERSLILIDEIASGTNPSEGIALTKSLIDYLMERPYITLITTHFETVTDKEGVRNMQVMGLSGADLSKLDSELRYANRKQRIDIIGKYMDYRLKLATDKSEIPKDALNIARMLGINDVIIEGAKKYI